MVRTNCIKKSYIFCLLLLVVSANLFVDLIVSAKPAINTKINYYNVTGQTIKEIANSLYKNSPIIDQGKKYHAHTSWNVKWHFYWQKYSNYCEITSVTTSVDIQYILPKLISYNSLSPSVKQKWDQYYTALINHESVHKNFGISSADSIEKTLKTMGTRNTCQQLEKDAIKIGKQIIKYYNDQEKQYDQITNHGATQGANFP
jgi:predicted secreted Zn-dependent protease